MIPARKMESMGLWLGGGLPVDQWSWGHGPYSLVAVTMPHHQQDRGAQVSTPKELPSQPPFCVKTESSSPEAGVYVRENPNAHVSAF